MKRSWEVWLEAHPDRTPMWLIGKIGDGFDVHHIDGKPSNNVPDNLVLIEHLDHMRLHGTPLVQRKPPMGPDTSDDELCYSDRLRGLKWHQIAKDRFGIASGSMAIARAKRYATVNGLQWPLRRNK